MDDRVALYILLALTSLLGVRLARVWRARKVAKDPSLLRRAFNAERILDDGTGSLKLRPPSNREPH